MRTTIIALTAGLLALAPAAASAADGGSAKDSAAQACKTERAAIGKTAFRELHGNLGKCIKQARKADEAARTNAAKTCKAEEAADAAAFATKYGTGKKGKNAFGKCVSQTAKADREAEQKTKINAAKQCKAERKTDAEAFAAAYGTKRNAFGKCVSKAAKA